MAAERTHGVPGRKRFLCVGLICLDIVSVCKQFPQEDQDVRALEQRWQRGGNAANQSDILAQLGLEVEFFGSLSDGLGVEFAVNTLKSRGVLTDNCIVHKGLGFPTSCVTISLANGSRTIVHYRPAQFPEVSSEDFQNLDLESYHWIHFEVRRNFEETLQMIAMINAFNASRNSSERIKVSIELEKIHEKSVNLLSSADLVIISKDLSGFLGYSSASTALQGLYNKIKPGGMLVCPWGSQGADGMGPEKVIFHSDAYPPDHVIDTLGAGDTFIAGLIKSLYDGKTLQDALVLGCKLAGYKCGRDGYNGLDIFWNHILKFSN